MSKYDFNSLKRIQVKNDVLHRQLYATDASVYKIYPEGVCFPENKEDIIELIHFARENKVPLIPRAGGTSLAGQVVGEGLVVDVSKHFNQIIDFDPKAKTIIVEPGIVRDDLNDFLAPHQLFLAPIPQPPTVVLLGG